MLSYEGRWVFYLPHDSSDHSFTIFVLLIGVLIALVVLLWQEHHIFVIDIVEHVIIWVSSSPFNHFNTIGRVLHILFSENRFEQFNANVPLRVFLTISFELYVGIN